MERNDDTPADARDAARVSRGFGTWDMDVRVLGYWSSVAVRTASYGAIMKGD
jgi:hypothetical protein